MENFFAGSKYALYFIGLFFIIIQIRTANRKEKTNKNIILIYIIYSLTNIFNIIDILPSTIIVFCICLIEMQVLTLNDDESILVTKTRYKILDYAFTMVNKYKAVQILILNILFSMLSKTHEFNIIAAFIVGGAKSGIYLDALPAIYNFSTIMKFIIGLTEAGVFLSYISKIYLNIFRVKRLDEIENEFIELSEGFYAPKYRENLDTKIQMLTDIEDNSFFVRQSSYISISFEALMYKINKSGRQIKKVSEVKKMTIEEKLKYVIDNFSKIAKLAIKIFKTLMKAVVFDNGVKRFIKRGYSTLEMQLMRQLAIETGYERVYRRKIYEWIYTHIFFKSLDQKRKYNNYQEHVTTYKKRIAYVYFKKVPTFFNIDGNTKKCKNIYDFYKCVRTDREINEKDLDPTEIVYALSLEEMFIFIVGLSGKLLWEGVFYLYDEVIERYNLDKEKIREIIFRIGNSKYFKV